MIVGRNSVDSQLIDYYYHEDGKMVPIYHVEAFFEATMDGDELKAFSDMIAAGKSPEAYKAFRKLTFKEYGWDAQDKEVKE